MFLRKFYVTLRTTTNYVGIAFPIISFTVGVGSVYGMNISSIAST